MADHAPLICRDVHKTFDQLEVLKGISLETRKGDVVSLIGSSGWQEYLPALYQPAGNTDLRRRYCAW